jgi:hypothetical protein
VAEGVLGREEKIPAVNEGDDTFDRRFRRHGKK